MNRYKINKGFIIQKLNEKTVIFDSEKSQLYTFNETASFIFSKIKSKIPEEKIASVLAKKYAVKPDKSIKDVNDLLKDLISKKIISVIK